MMDGEPKGDSYSGMSLSDADLARLVGGGVLDPREVLRAIEKYEAEGSLLAFLRLAWPQFEPGKLEISWHHEAIAEHLEAVSAGEIRRLLINVPPRSSKTSIVSIAWPAWVWCQSERTPLKGPQVRFMCVCYAASLSLEIATTARRLVTSDWYQGWWGDRVAPDPDEFNRARFANKAGGYRIAASIEGGTLGRGGDCVVGGTIVETRGGAKRVSDIDLSAAPEYILTYEADKQALAYRRIVAIVRREARSIWRVRTAAGRMVEATGEHPFFTGRGWVRAMALGEGDVLLCSVRGGGDTARERDGEEARAGWSILQSELRDDCEERSGWEEAVVLPCVREEAAAKGQASGLFLRSGLPEGCLSARRAQSANDCGSSVRDMRGEFQAAQHEAAGSILFAGVQGHWARDSDARRDESGLSAWDSVHAPLRFAETLAGGARASACAGWEALRGMPLGGEHSGSSHQHQSGGSPAGELGLSMQELSHGGSCGGAFEAEEDYVSVVEGVRGEEVVYDIQVEGTECFFANGILVHNCKIIDDPNKVSDVESEIERMRVLRAYDEALATRVTDPRSTAEVVIMQRLHEEDLSGHILSQNIGGWDHLMIPQQYDPRRYVQTSIGWTDPRGALDEEEQAEYDGALAVNPKAPHPHDGMLMWPDRFDEEWVEREQLRMGSVAWSGQMQQIPVGRGTEIIKPEWWQFWGEDEFPEYGTCVASLDTAYSERETADYNAFTLWFAFQGVDGRPKVMLASAWRVRTNLADLARRVVRSCQGLAPSPLRVATDAEGRLVAEKVGPKAEILLIEDAARGKDLRDEIWRLLGGRRQLRIDLVRPAGDKVARLNSCVPVFEAGVVYAPERDWSDEVINEIASFPRGRHDDYVDSVSMALRWLRENGVALRGVEHEEELRERRTYRKRQTALYDV